MATSATEDERRHTDLCVTAAGLFGAEQFSRMRPRSLFLNLSRGFVVDHEALRDHILSGHIAGAAVDVFPTEPKGNDDPFVSELVGMDNVLLTPHVGGSTLEAQENIGIEVAAKLIRYSDNGSTLSAVNFPEVSLPGHSGSRRLLHIHENRPGMLMQINNLFSAAAVNIDAQYLQTAGQIGYVVIDVDAGEAQARDLRDRLAAIEGTLRTRLLY